jgi:phospholipase D
MALQEDKNHKRIVMNLKTKFTITLTLVITAPCSFAKSSVPSEYVGTLSGAKYQLCFTPSQTPMQCTDMLTNAIGKAKDNIIVQAYSFTSAPIVKALIEAQKRGVKIVALVDKSNITAKYSVVRTLTNANIPVYVDYKPAIAHNKVMIIDGKEVVTGSFNFTKSAQVRNAENLLIIDDAKLASQYKANFNNRIAESQSLPDYCESTGKCKSWWDTVKSSSASVYEKTKQESAEAWKKVKDWWSSN